MSRNDRIIKKLYETPEEREMKRFIVGLIILGVITIIFAILTNFGRYDNEQEEKELPTQLQYIAYETVAPVVETTTAEAVTETTTETSAETTAADPFISLGEFKLTAYCSCVKCCEVWAIDRPVDETGKEIVYTASGTKAKAGRTIAVDTSVIPYGTSVIINGNEYVAEDCGGAIKGNRIDVFFDTHSEAKDFGVQYAEIFIKRQEG